MSDSTPERSLAVTLDIDGTCFDTEALVRKAYETIGVLMPKKAWGLPWQQWLPGVVGDLREAEHVHHAKTLVYRQMLNDSEVAILPPGELAMALAAEGHGLIGFITGASQDAAETLVARLGFDPDRLWMYGANREAKHTKLALMTPTHDVIYIDDDHIMIEMLASSRVRTIHYVGQGLLELLKEPAWTP